MRNSFNPSNWSVKNAIQARVDIEDIKEWGNIPNEVKTPKIALQSVTKGIKRSNILKHFYKNYVLIFRP